MSHTSIDCSVAGVAVDAWCLRVLMRLLWRPTTGVARITPRNFGPNRRQRRQPLRALVRARVVCALGHAQRGSEARVPS